MDWDDEFDNDFMEIANDANSDSSMCGMDPVGGLDKDMIGPVFICFRGVAYTHDPFLLEFRRNTLMPSQSASCSLLFPAARRISAVYMSMMN